MREKGCSSSVWDNELPYNFVIFFFLIYLSLGLIGKEK